MRCPIIPSLALVLLTLVGAGCAKSPPPDFYLLAPGAPTQLPGFEDGVAVGVGPVELPPHLDRNQIVSRDSQVKLRLSERNQWAEPIKVGFTRVLLVTLGLELDSNRIYGLPTRRRQTLDYQIAVDVLRFDGELGKEVVLGARWTLLGGDGETVLVSKVSQVREPASAEDYEAFVAAQSRAVEQIGREMAAAITAQMR